MDSLLPGYVCTECDLPFMKWSACHHHLASVHKRAATLECQQICKARAKAMLYFFGREDYSECEPAGSSTRASEARSRDASSSGAASDSQSGLSRSSSREGSLSYRSGPRQESPSQNATDRSQLPSLPENFSLPALLLVLDTSPVNLQDALLQLISESAMPDELSGYLSSQQAKLRQMAARALGCLRWSSRDDIKMRLMDCLMEDEDMDVRQEVFSIMLDLSSHRDEAASAAVRAYLVRLMHVKLASARAIAEFSHASDRVGTI